MTDYDFADELRGDTVNEKGNGIVPAIVVAVIVSGANLWIARGIQNDDSTAVELAALKERVQNLADQVGKLAAQPYARRDELERVENRVTGLEQRVGNVERAAVVGGGR